MEADALSPAEIEMDSFLSSWFGPAKSSAKEIGPEFDWIPAGLKKWYEITSRWEIPVEGVKRLIPPSEILEEEGKFIFLMDQGGWAWSFDLTEPSFIFEAKDDEPWRRLNADWSEMLLWHSFSEAVEYAPFTQWSSNASAEAANEVLSNFRKVSFTDSMWPSPGWAFYIADGMVADAGPSKWTPDSFSITVGASSRESIASLNSPTGIEWLVRQK
ncbi:hypothetical protein [Streptomyces bikiniensis]|uniref:hypothetical protein n=1 Tax=Streptomyces bikiniensis TaxID=1896 RepID=UPI00131A4A55|nr:hypothetical protein [Streptomyces bikiniensis]